MVNLSTVYAISIVLASVAGMGSAFLGHRFYPIVGGAAKPPPSPSEVYAEAKKTAELAERLASAQIPPKEEETEIPPEPEVPTKSEDISANAPTDTNNEPPLEPSAEPEVPTKSEEIPAEAPTDTNNEPPEIPTYLPEPEPEAQPEPEVKEEENTIGGGIGLVDEIKDVFGKDDIFASNMAAFIKTPVQNWTQIASTPEELFEKFKETLNDPDLPNCPANLMNLCKLVVVKYTNMEKFSKGDPSATLYGDQTDAAIQILSNIE